MTYHATIIVAMKLAGKKMDCYYSLTDSSPIVLPQLRLLAG